MLVIVETELLSVGWSAMLRGDWWLVVININITVGDHFANICKIYHNWLSNLQCQCPRSFIKYTWSKMFTTKIHFTEQESFCVETDKLQRTKRLEKDELFYSKSITSERPIILFNLKLTSNNQLCIHNCKLLNFHLNLMPKNLNIPRVRTTFTIRLCFYPMLYILVTPTTLSIVNYIF